MRFSPLSRGVLLGAWVLCLGCGATGLDWVGEAHLESASQQQRAASNEAERVGRGKSSSIPATAEPNSAEARPRLSHTITLGEIDVVAVSDGAGREAAPGPLVTVNNYNQLNVVTPALGYGTFGYFRSQPGFSPTNVAPGPSLSSTSGVQPGQDWPSVADHGPSFPYGSTPAPPWSRSR